MERRLVASLKLRSVGYDAETGTLEIEFLGNTVHHYFNVPETVYTDLLNARSKGSYHASNIKERYRYKIIK